MTAWVNSSGLRLALGVRPAMTARSDKRGAVFCGEVVQREYGADREFRAGPGKMRPVAFVAVQHLGRFPPADNHRLRGVQPVRATVGQQIMIGKGFEHGVEEDLNKRG